MLREVGTGTIKNYIAAKATAGQYTRCFRVIFGLKIARKGLTEGLVGDNLREWRSVFRRAPSR